MDNVKIPMDNTWQTKNGLRSKRSKARIVNVEGSNNCHPV